MTPCRTLSLTDKDKELYNTDICHRAYRFEFVVPKPAGVYRCAHIKSVLAHPPTPLEKHFNCLEVKSLKLRNIYLHRFTDIEIKKTA